MKLDILVVILAIVLLLVSGAALWQSGVQINALLTVSITCLALAAAVFVSRFAIPSLKANLALGVVSSIVAALIGYGVLKLTGRDALRIVDSALLSAVPGSTAGPAVPATDRAGLGGAKGLYTSPGRPMDNRTFQVITSALRESGLAAYRIASPHFLLDLVGSGEIGFLPLSGISRVYTVTCNEGDQKQLPTPLSDRYGFNNDDTVYSWDNERILLIGDSYVFGFCVHQEQTIAGVLRRSGYAGISAGIGGNAPLTNLGALREYGPALKPKAVVWFHFDRNDVVDMRDRGLRSAFMLRYLDRGFSQGLVHRQPQIDALWKGIFDADPAWHDIVKAYYANIQRWTESGRPTDPKLLQFVREKLSDDSIETLTEDNDLVKIMLGIVRIARADTESWGGKFYFARVRSVLWYRGAWNPTYEDRIVDGVRAMGIPIIDIKDTIQASGNSNWFFPETTSEGHHNWRGYATFAQAVIDAITPRENIIVREATLGGNCKDTKVAPPQVNIVFFGNATQAVNGECMGKKTCAFEIWSAKIGGEPADGCPKDFIAKYTCGRSRDVHEVYAQEPADGKKVELICP
jgi:hypothetical protein